MPEKIVIGPINRGLRNDRTAFVIDNDSFPFLLNAYQWRGRVKRKRGTSLLGRLHRYIGTTSALGALSVTISPIPIPVGTVIFEVGSDIFVDQGGVSPVVLATNGSGVGVLDRATGSLQITLAQPNTSVFYYPKLPVMGLEELNLNASLFPGTIAFDTKYSYNINTADPYDIYDVTFFKNLPTGFYPGYVQKAAWTPFNWNGQDYQQFWSVNYQNALWVTNGISSPFTPTNVGMQFKEISGVVVGVPPLANLTIVAHGLVVGDFVFINEVGGITGINFQTGYVTVVVNLNTVTVEFPNATLGGVFTTGGIAQYLTSNAADPTKDGIRWYDGDPTDGNATTPTLNGTKGWVNFAPPLSKSDFSISDLPADQYYLAGARMIINFKDRLLFIGPVVQSSSAGSQVYLQDTIIYSQNGTPYYTASFTGDASLPTTVFTPILVPTNQTATAPAFWGDQTGFGGFIEAGIAQPMITVSTNEDVLIVGFENLQSRVVYTGNDIVPFNLFIINSEYGSSSTFSAINMDEGVITRGSRGFVMTSQTQTRRVDLEIPDEVFQINLKENGSERFCSQRDFISEWIYFTYPSNQVDSVRKFPNRSLQYNYRDNSWSVFNESYTTYGVFKKQTGFIWSTVGNTFNSWSEWNEAWNAGSSTLLQPTVIGGNQQGFIVFRDDGTNESPVFYIQSISGNTITSPDHGLNDGDYISISGVFGTLSSQLNGRIFSAYSITKDTFKIDPSITSGTYLGGGFITRLYVPYIQSKQFPTGWGISRKIRLGAQQYLFTTTQNAQIQLLIFLSQNSDDPYNDGGVIPSVFVKNSALVYSTVLYTCPESTNLGLTPANTNLQMPTAVQQEQIWHRMNTSLIGDTVQVGFSISDSQMRELVEFAPATTITGITPGTTTVIDTNNEFSANQLVKISGVVGMTELNGNVYYILSVTDTSITIDVDSSAFTPYVSGGTVVKVANVNATAEIELHSIVIDVSPSQFLA
jgi:hypothetical protein